MPTSRAASLVVVKDKVARDMFYDGRMKMERCAVVLRIAPTWFRWTRNRFNMTFWGKK